ncbi:MAG TPA: zf-HC2 domain-containing protein [Candidatus Limnocylindria bacterium]|nr:zf-HC2 domain-containing protein [Candidatus Limnocylindria bacterium]
MTVLRPGEHADELISASLTGDLTEVERATLEQHLASCARCRETLAAFRQERQLISGMHHLQPPADLGARVRAGIEAGDLPWWRRRSTLVATVGSLGAVAAGLLAVVVLSNLRPGPVAQQSATPSASFEASVSLAPSPTASVYATPSASQSEPPEQTPAPVVAIREPIARFTYRIEDQETKLQLVANGGESELEVGPAMAPIDAALSPDGDWLAFRVEGEDSGLVSTYAFRQSDETLVSLGQQGMNSPFSRLSWSAFGELLAFTHVDQTGAADVWVLDTRSPEPTPVRITNTGRTFAGSFYGGGDEAWLWVSTAEEGSPTSYRIALPLDGPMPEPTDPAHDALASYPGVFLPVDNQEGPFDEGPAVPPIVAFWSGEMTQEGGSGWRFTRGGMLYRASASIEGDFELEGGRPEFQVFDTLQVQPNGAAFESARFAWAPDRDGLAVWDTQWAGVQQPEGFPDAARVYYAHAWTGRGTIGPLQALDAGDTEGNRVVHVGLGGGQYLAVTVATEAGAHSGAYGPTAELRVIKRNLGTVPDEVEASGQDRVWVGPGIYPAFLSDPQ